MVRCTLETNRRWTPALSQTLQDVQADDDVTIEPIKELAYFRRATGNHFAIVVDDQVLGYLSGSMRNGKTGYHIVDEEDVVAFIRLIAIRPASRGQGAGYQAIRAFAHQANERESATILTLELDDAGDRARRQNRFERMGFVFIGKVGLLRADEVLRA